MATLTQPKYVQLIYGALFQFSKFQFYNHGRCNLLFSKLITNM